MFQEYIFRFTGRIRGARGEIIFGSPITFIILNNETNYKNGKRVLQSVENTSKRGP